ncbi:MAG: hypothetical protein ACRERU_12180 [Methylococcales bacterium]
MTNAAHDDATHPNGVLAIIGPTTLTFRFPKAVLDQVALGLDPRNFPGRCRLRRIGKAIVGNFFRADFPAYQKVPTVCLFFPAVPNLPTQA